MAMPPVDLHLVITNGNPVRMTMMEPKDVAAIAGAIVALAALLKGVLEYELQGRQKRAEHFITMRQRFKGNETFRELCAMCEQDDEKLRTVPFKDKRDILGFFEEVALMTNSGLLRPRVAQYMFGYYAMSCWRSVNFWNGVNKESLYWTLFRDFVARMEVEEQKFRNSRSGLRF